MSDDPDRPLRGAWIEFADAAVQRLAVLHRVARGAPPDEFAGLRISEGDVDAILVELSGPGDAEAVAAIQARLDPVLDGARQRFTASLSDANPFASLVANARLTAADAEVLAVAMACEMDVRLARLIAYVQDDVTRTRLTMQTVGRLLDDAGGTAGVVGHDASLRRSAFVTVIEDGPWAQHSIVVEPAVVWALVGDTALDPALDAYATVIECADASGAPFVVVTGRDRIRRRQEAARRTLGDRFLVVSQPVDEAGWMALVREATLSGLGVIIEIDDDLSPEGRRWIRRADHVAWAVSSRHELPLTELPRRPWVEYQAPADETTPEEWAAAFGDGVDRTHHLSPEQVDLVGGAFRARHGDLDAAVRRLVAGRLERLARRVRPQRSWEDIILSGDRMAQLRGIVSRYRYADTVYDDWGFLALPSRGLVALFSGPSGTGKTLAAEILAGELGLDVFKLDLSSVVSKYIGETEKNLEQVFDAAGAGNVVLFFDEADALFGKRSEVKDARDRYANIEVSYLLQRLEAYDGIVILATNFEKNIDDAFLRRIHERIEFIVPGPVEREAIWRHNLPERAPIDDLDVPWLAKQFEMSGGQIRNAAVQAAFIAAADGTSITMECVVRGVARELRKGGRLLKPADFGPYHAVVASG